MLELIATSTENKIYELSLLIIPAEYNYNVSANMFNLTEFVLCLIGLVLFKFALWSMLFIHISILSIEISDFDSLVCKSLYKILWILL